MKELIIKKGDKQITVADKEDVMDALNGKVSTNDPKLSDTRTPRFVSIGASSSSIKDLNDYTTGGFYYCNSDSTMAPYINNCPLSSTDNKSFFLLVETWGVSSNYVKQTLTYYHTNQTYTRTKRNTDGWSPWSILHSGNDSGGVNLLTGTQDFSGASRIDLNSGISSYNNIKYITVDNTSGTYKDIIFNIPPETFDYGEKFTLSFWANGNGTICVYNYGSTNYIKTKVLHYTEGGKSICTNTYHDGNCAFTLTGNKWKRYSVTWELNPTQNSSNDINVEKYLIFRTYNNTVARWGGIMYEKGEVAHDWAPSPLENSIFDYTDIKGTDNTVGYIKALKLQVRTTYQDKPIKIEAYQRNRKTTNTINIAFQNAGHTDPGISTGSFSYYGDENFKAYLYKESAGVWSLITSKSHADKYGEMMIKVSNPNPGISITRLDTHIASLPSSTTNNPLYTASCLEKITTATVTYTDGSTGTINFVTR